MASATISAYGQISIPPEILRSLGVDAGDRVEFVQLEPGKVLLLAANRSVTELKGMFGEASKIISIDEMNRAIVAHETYLGEINGCRTTPRPHMSKRLSDQRHRMMIWLTACFSDERRARNTVLTTALVLGTVGFFLLMGMLVLGRHWRS